MSDEIIEIINNKKYKDKFTKYDMSDIIELAKASRGE